MRRALPLLIFLLLAAPAQADDLDRTDRESANAALEHVEDIIDEPRAGGPHELTPALIELARQRADLSAANRRRANELLSRPPEGDDPGRWNASEADQASDCTLHFCFHWVDVATDPDAPPLQDGSDSGDRPDYIDLVATSFEQAYSTEVGTLGWAAPVPDGDHGGGTDLVDVYISDIGRTYGYAVPEVRARTSYGYVVIDNDYRASDFPRYNNDPTIPVQATAAHEFNHVLQYAYDTQQDLWMYEATATWAEEKVYDAANDYVSYLRSWATLPFQPITSAGSGTPSGLKQYGSAIFNHWLEGRWGQNVVREAWARSQATSPGGGSIGFAPGAFDSAIRAAGGPGFTEEFETFSAATAEWDAANSGIREASTFPVEVRRDGTLIPGGVTVTGPVAHTAMSLWTVAPTNATELHLTSSLPPGTAGAVALVGEADGSQTRVVRALDSDGRVTVTLPEPARYSEITAMVANADTSFSGFDGADWIWRKDAQEYSLTATTGAVPVEPTPTPTPTATATATPTPPPPVKTSVRLSRSTTRIRSAVRTRKVALFATTNKAGALSATSTVDRATARRLRVGRRTTSTGTGRRTAIAPGRFKINVKLTRKARAALKRHKSRTVRIKVRVGFVPADGTPAVTRSLSLLLRP